MTEQEKQQAIAEHLGWTEVYLNEHTWEIPKLVGYVPNSTLLDSQGARDQLGIIPDYFHDFSALQEAERLWIFNDTGRFEEWCRILFYIVRDLGLSGTGKQHALMHAIASATTEQRAEAFGQALNLW